jgi:GT2 family glycosyltransferase
VSRPRPLSSGAVPTSPAPKWRFVAPPPESALEPRSAPTFSVVIAAHQAEATIREAIHSALDQTVPPHEVIVVVDGNSQDRTVEAAASFGDRVQVIRQQQRGASAAVNAGARRATGDFIAILDADDAYLPRRLEALSALAATRPDLDLLMTDAFFEVGGRSVGRFSHETPFAAEDQVAAIFDRCYLVAPAYRRERFLDVGGYDEEIRSGYDWDGCIRLLASGSRAGAVDAPLYRYRMTEGSLSDNRVATLRARVAVLRKAAANLDLRPGERSSLDRALRRNLQRAQLTEAEGALRVRARDSRKRALAVALGPGFGPLTRAKALVAALAPGVAARRLENRETKSGRSRLQRSYPR